MKRWYYMEDFPYFIETIPPAFKELNIPIATPTFKPNPTQLNKKNQLMEHLRRFKPDIIMTSGWTPFNRDMYYKVIQEYCQTYNAFHVYWSLEDPLHTETWGKYVAKSAQPDFIFTHEFGFNREYEQLGFASAYLPLAANPVIHKPKPALAKYNADIALVGNYNPSNLAHNYRMQSLNTLVKPLVTRGYDVAIWGEGWENYAKSLPSAKNLIRGPVPYQDVPTIYSSAKIILGIQNTPNLLTRRTFECLGSGGFLLTLDTPALRRHFTAGDDLVTSNSPAKTVAHVNQYLKNSTLRKQIAQKGMSAVRAKHTYTHRIQEIKKHISPYVKAKKKGRKLFHLPSKVKEEVRPDRIISLNSYSKRTSNQFCLSNNSRPRQSLDSIIKFPLKQPANYKVIKATLHLFLINRASGAPTIECYPLRFPWNNRGKPQQLKSKKSGTIQINNTFASTYPWKQNKYSIDLTEIVENWLANARTNHGIYLKLKPTTRGKVEFTTLKDLGPYRRFAYKQRFTPYLEIEYQKTNPKAKNGLWNGFPN